MNSITIAGNVARDMELKLVGKDTVGTFAVADNQGKDRPAIFWNCNLWGSRASSLEPYITKGQPVTITGTITEREWDKDGVKRKAMDVRVNDVALQGGKRDDSGAQNAKPAPQRQQPRAQAPAGGGGAFSDFEDDIPFAPMGGRKAHYL